MHEHKPKPKRPVADPVSCTELGPELIETFFVELHKRDPIPKLPDEYKHSIKRLRSEMKQGTLDGAITLLKNHELFQECFGERGAMISQIRNAAPSDVSVLHRHKEGKFDVPRMLSVSLQDPTGPLEVDPRLFPVFKKRKTGDPQRKVFGLHELADFELVQTSKVFCSIYPSGLESWFAMILKRTTEFTWVLTLWCRLREPGDVPLLRAGLEKVAKALARNALKRIELKGSRLVLPDSLHEGMLVLDSKFREVRLQNYAAETMMLRLRDASHRPLARAVFHECIAREYGRRIERKLSTAWQIDEFGHPSPFGIVALDVQPLAGDIVILMTELAAAPPELAAAFPEQLLVSGLATHARSKLATYIKNERKAVYSPPLQSVVRPLIESDMVAGRIHRYPEATGTEIVKTSFRDRLRREGPMSLLFRPSKPGQPDRPGLIVGVIIPV